MQRLVADAAWVWDAHEGLDEAMAGAELDLAGPLVLLCRLYPA